MSLFAWRVPGFECANRSDTRLFWVNFCRTDLAYAGSRHQDGTLPTIYSQFFCGRTRQLPHDSRDCYICVTGKKRRLQQSRRFLLTGYKQSPHNEQ
jgi:hypothetical protein